MRAPTGQVAAFHMIRSEIWTQADYGDVIEDRGMGDALKIAGIEYATKGFIFIYANRAAERAHHVSDGARREHVLLRRPAADEVRCANDVNRLAGGQGAPRKKATAAERRRRNRLVAPRDARIREMPFVEAPFIHPNNEPKYHALLVRAVEHAKRGKRHEGHLGDKEAAGHDDTACCHRAAVIARLERAVHRGQAQPRDEIVVVHRARRIVGDG